MLASLPTVDESASALSSVLLQHCRTVIEDGGGMMADGRWKSTGREGGGVEGRTWPVAKSVELSRVYDGALSVSRALV